MNPETELARLTFENKNLRCDSANYRGKCGVCCTANMDMLTDNYCVACEVDRLTTALHANRCHPDYVYVVVPVDTKWKQLGATPLSNEGWEPNPEYKAARAGMSAGAGAFKETANESQSDGSCDPGRRGRQRVGRQLHFRADRRSS